MRNRQDSRGFTLFEFILVLLLLGIFTTISGTMILHSMNATNESRNSWNTLDDLRYASERMAREIREMRRDPADLTAYQATTWSASALSFTRYDGVEVTIQYSDPSDQIEMIYPATSATAQQLVDQVDSFSFSYLQANHTDVATTLQNLAYVVIDLTLSDEGVLYQDRVTVSLRNRMGWN